MSIQSSRAQLPRLMRRGITDNVETSKKKKKKKTPDQLLETERARQSNNTYTIDRIPSWVHGVAACETEKRV